MIMFLGYFKNIDDCVSDGFDTGVIKFLESSRNIVETAAAFSGPVKCDSNNVAEFSVTKSFHVSKVQ